MLPAKGGSAALTLLMLSTAFSSDALAVDTSSMVLIPQGSYQPFFATPPASIANVINQRNEQRPLEQASDAAKAAPPIPIPAFWMDAYPVTRAQFYSFLNKHPEWDKKNAPALFVDALYLTSKEKNTAPMTAVSWFASMAYCNHLGKTLPTIDQFEYVYANNQQDQEEINRQVYSWYSYPATAALREVGTSTPNSFGVYDLYGLIWEWVFDFNAIIVAGGDGRDISDSDTGLFCGSGSLNSLDPTDYSAFLRFSVRTSLKARYSTKLLGFRCVYEP